MKTQDIRNILQSTNGKWFSVKFVKKDKTIRHMTCRIGVQKHLRGGVSTTSHKDTLMTVWCSKAKNYRVINLDTIISAKIAGVEMVFNKELETNYE